MGGPLDIHLIQPPADGFPWKTIIEIAPQLLWVGIAIAFLVAIGPAGLRAALARVSKLSLAGLEIELASKVEEAFVRKKLTASLGDRQRIARRLDRSSALFNGARLLWIDDNPQDNSVEFEILRELGTIIDLATTDAMARDQITRAVYDVLLTDMTRGHDHAAGKNLITELEKAQLKPPIIFYVRASRHTKPEKAFGLTTRPDELFHLITDALERQRG
jgi:CheY-like chemotaxis protein